MIDQNKDEFQAKFVFNCVRNRLDDASGLSAVDAMASTYWPTDWRQYYIWKLDDRSVMLSRVFENLSIELYIKDVLVNNMAIRDLEEDEDVLVKVEQFMRKEWNGVDETRDKEHEQ